MTFYNTLSLHGLTGEMLRKFKEIDDHLNEMIKRKGQKLMKI
jgi:hypothetical protein